MSGQRRLPVIREKKLKSRSNRKLLALLLFFFITLLVIIFFKSSMSRISDIDISGNRHITLQEIGQAIQIKQGDHFFAISSNTLAKRVLALNIVKSVKVRKSFPGHVAIDITEFPEVAFQIAKEGAVEIVLENGTEVKLNNSGMVVDKPVLTGWDKKADLKRQLCGVLATIPDELLTDISEIKPDPSDAFADKIKMYTRSLFEVSTTISYFPKKIEYMRSIIAEKAPGHITMLLADHYAPFEKDVPQESEIPDNNTEQ